MSGGFMSDQSDELTHVCQGQFYRSLLKRLASCISICNLIFKKSFSKMCVEGSDTRLTQMGQSCLYPFTVTAVRFTLQGL